ncbi:cytochrome P450 CYP736A12-like [Cucurbita pepo subsp. pepo]|uniref:cytochrome P450 CYP736A12-like n=1 Tax=Cucurbita pepo subsp. pepo TaxID=3664 RepID=UPI000C9D7242|nr:cytochrome P450 CYP736A12-like [Cucurbita pepo subsp. pepo]
MAWILLAVALVGVALLWRSWLHRGPNQLPPGPRGLPILGSLHLLGKLPHRDLRALSQKYGSIMYMRLGLVPTIVVTSPQAAELFLKTYDSVFASRPFLLASKYISYGQKNLGFAPYGSYWRNMRKMCTLELLSNVKVNSFRSMRREEVGLLVDYLRDAAKNRAVVNLSSKICCVITDMTCLMVFGKKYADQEFDERGFKSVIQEALQLVAIPNLGDFIPPIAALDLQGLDRRSKAVSKIFDGFLEKIIDDHLESKHENKTKDFVDVMLEIMSSQETEYQIERSNIKAILLDMLVAGMDTSATTIGWAIPELIRHPHVMKKMQDELEKVVGFDKKVEESDLEQLEYLDMVVKEILRLHPPAPILVPHESLEDCVVDGFYIPKKSRIIVNGWAIGRDPNFWIEPEKFFPERFMGSQLDVKGRDFQLIPFGSGRRGCPGMQLGLTMVRLVVAQLVHCFDWKLPNDMLPDELDMTEEFGLTCPRAEELMVTPSYRLNN